MYENYDNKKRLLYVSVFVAALLVASLSGTFAYFQASATNNSVISGTIANTNITLTVTKMDAIDANTKTAPNGITLVPFDVIDSNGGNVNTVISNATNKGCIDDDDYNACDVFKIAVQASNPLKVNGYLEINPTTGSKIPNVKWILLKEKTTTNYSYIKNISVTSSYLVNANIKSQGVESLFTNLSDSDQTINTTTSYYYVMVWLEDTGDFQDDEGDYIGTVTFKGQGTNEGQITAKFN